jgi:hypothetical protein
MSRAGWFHGVSGMLVGVATLTASAVFEISPARPTERDDLTLVVQRSFSQDCRWEVSPTVRRVDRKIDVTLVLSGQANCDQAMTERTFEVPIGRHPAGNYLVAVRWSDGEELEARSLTVLRAADADRSSRAPAGTPTFVLDAIGDARALPPMAEERRASAGDRAFLSRLMADYGSATLTPLERAPAPVFWNELTTELGLKSGLPPPSQARAYALTQIAMYDALSVAADERRGRLPEDAVAAGAASRILLHLFPLDSVRIRDAAASQIDAGALDDARRAFLLGRGVGELVVRHARGDGYRSDPTVSRGTGPSAWFGIAPVLPNAGNWRTWITASGGEVEPAAPYPLGSADDLRDLEDVYRASLERTPAQIAAARKWADWPPPTIWNDELNRRLSSRRWSAVAGARASAYLNAAMFDAFVACWRSKYRFWTQRPYMRLRGRTPAFTTVVTTPNFPSYTSGHSTVSGAAAVVLAELFPDESETFAAQAREAALSRFWAGIHFAHDNDEGLAVGTRIGEKAVQRMRRHPSP